MHTMSKFQYDCFRRIELIKIMNMKTDHDFKKLILSILMLKFSNVNIYT